jgi:gamma-glutamyltranspeptidase/glutathione hydrolase
MKSPFLTGVWLIALGAGSLAAQSVDLSPARWPGSELKRFDSLTIQWRRPIPLAEGSKGMIVATSGAAAVRAGFEALQQGGSAIDAALTHAFAEIVLLASCCVTHAGFMTMAYYEAATGKVHSMNAAWNAVLGETDPLTIPRGTPSGRTALVPGFMAGAEAAHKKFGKLPWKSLFVPAIYFAEQGITLSPVIGGMIAARKDVLGRLPATKAVFTRPDGQWYQTGDLFKQPAVAGTLRKVAEQGASYMYRGDWAKKLVAAVQADGGKMTMKDLESYQVIWSEPAKTRYRDYEVHAIGLPNTGGLNLVEALNVAELADLRRYGHFATSAEGLFHLIRIGRVAEVMGTSITARGNVPTPVIERDAPELAGSLASRLSKEHAHRVWAKMQTPGWNQFDQNVFEWQAAAWAKELGHSDAVVTVDAAGNVAAVLHTINTDRWGRTGIFIDGVPIADPAAFQQGAVARAGPGGRVADPTNPLIVLKNGKPVLASSSIATGLHEQTLQNVINVLEFGMDPKTSVDGSQFLRPIVLTAGDATRDLGAQQVAEGEFPVSLLDAVRGMGLKIKTVPAAQAGSSRGGWIGIALDPATGRLRGGATAMYNGWALGY